MLTQREAALLSFRRAHLAFAAMTSDELLSLLSALPGARRLPADPLLIETGALHEVLQRVATCPRLEAVRELVAELDRLDKAGVPRP